MRGRAICADQHARFIEQLRKVPNVTLAARLAGFSERTAYEHRKHDTEFADAWDEALKQGAANLLSAVWDRSLNGIESYVVSQGRIVADPESGLPLKERKFQDNIALRLLQAHMPEYAAVRASDKSDDIPAELQPDPEPKPDEDAPPVIE